MNESVALDTIDQATPLLPIHFTRRFPSEERYKINVSDSNYK